ncbi:MAG: alkaline phosphatase family protein, partial [Candidatus Binatia bacterium]
MANVVKPTVIAIGLDSAEPDRIDDWIDRGYLPTIGSLRSRGAYCRFKGPTQYRAEQAWTSVLTGCDPRQTGYWTGLQFDAATYHVQHRGTYDYREYPPFYALGPDYRVAVFDMPQTRISDRVDGIQILAWGAHSAGAASASRPTHLIAELSQAYGSHPALNRDHASFWNPLAMMWLRKALETGIRRRAEICRHLLRRERWDLFLTAFSEPHSAGHFFWHLSDERHPLHKANRSAIGDPMLQLFRSIDHAIGEIVAAGPPEASVVLFSPEGMQSNSLDLPSLVFLPELLFRFNFPGEVGLADRQRSARIPPPIDPPKSLGWYRDLYARRHDR